MNVNPQLAFHDRVQALCWYFSLDGAVFHCWVWSGGCQYRLFYQRFAHRIAPLVEWYPEQELLPILSWGPNQDSFFVCDGVRYETHYTGACDGSGLLLQLEHFFTSRVLLRTFVVAILSAGMFDYLKCQARSIGDLSVHHSPAEIMAREDAGLPWHS